jgi:hypothetical protein
MVQNDENDKNFVRELFKSTLDLEKAMKGIYGNFLLRTFFENAAKSVDFELKLPFKKVCANFLSVNHSLQKKLILRL